MSASTCSGVKATQSTTASNVASPERLPHLGRVADVRVPHRRPGGGGRCRVLPRFSTVRSMPCSTALRAQAELITPLPPMNRTRKAVTRPP